MWMIVMFDLPVVADADRKAATAFRNSLLDMGFEMSQFSVYLRFCTSYAQFDRYSKQVERILPDDGKVHILQFTDKQYEKIQFFEKSKSAAGKKPPNQLALF
jgi:CRISPR-associated protein Cas2